MYMVYGYQSIYVGLEVEGLLVVIYQSFSVKVLVVSFRKEKIFKDVSIVICFRGFLWFGGSVICYCESKFV